jgi:hypothetical protein
MKKGSTLFLRGVLVVMGLIALAICVFLVPHISKSLAVEFSNPWFLNYPTAIILYATGICFYAALYQTMKLLGYIDKNMAFSELSVSSLKKIKYSGIVMSTLYLSCMPVAYWIAELDDAPGVILVALAFALSPLVISVFAAVLQRLLRNAIDMKSENDLTV